MSLAEINWGRKSSRSLQTVFLLLYDNLTTFVRPRPSVRPNRNFQIKYTGFPRRFVEFDQGPSRTAKGERQIGAIFSNKRKWFWVLESLAVRLRVSSRSPSRRLPTGKPFQINDTGFLNSLVEIYKKEIMIRPPDSFSSPHSRRPPKSRTSLIKFEAPPTL